MLTIRLLNKDDGPILESVADGVFDKPIDRGLAAEYLGSPHNHLAVAIDNGVVVGFASGIDYVHPDKPREFWVNEVAVAPAHRRRGIGNAVLNALLAHARELDCKEAWTLTKHDNGAARSMYEKVGGFEESALMVAFSLRREDNVDSH